MKRFFLSALTGFLFASPALSFNKTVQAQSAYSQFFTEKTLTVSRENDGILPGTLRTALIQANGIRAQNSFAMVHIVFDPNLKRIRITKGPLPELEGSLTTLDCATSSGRGIIEGVAGETAGQDPSEEFAGLKLTSNGNTIRNCHITGFAGPGILIRGNRNIIEDNAVGYHKNAPETSIEISALYEDPKTNQGAGIVLDEGANENLIQHNDIVANTYNGVLLAERAGTANRIWENNFSKNSGKPIAALAKLHSTKRPALNKVTRQGEFFVISGTAELGAEVQIYLLGKDENEITSSISQRIIASQGEFSISIKNKGFQTNQTRIAALAQARDKNSSEFSNAVIVDSSTPSNTPEPEIENPYSPPDSHPTEENIHTEKANDLSRNERERIIEEVTQENLNSVGQDLGTPITPSNSSSDSEQPDSVIDIHGLGDKGGQPVSGSLPAKINEMTNFGI